MITTIFYLLDLISIHLPLRILWSWFLMGWNSTFQFHDHWASGHNVHSCPWGTFLPYWYCCNWQTIHTVSNGYLLPQSTASRTCNYMRASFVLEWMFQKFKDVIPGSFWEFVLVRWCQESCFECPSPNGCALADRLLSCWNITFTRIACMVLAVWNYFVAREFLVCIWTCRSLILYLRCCVHLFISAFRACMACKTNKCATKINPSVDFFNWRYIQLTSVNLSLEGEGLGSFQCLKDDKNNLSL